MLMVPKSARAHSIKSRVVPKSAVARERVKENYPLTYAIIDGTEIFIETPSDLQMQSSTWSEYKHHNTSKCLIGCTPNGSVCFVSPLYVGSISDVELTRVSGFVTSLPTCGTKISIMADKGFTIRDQLSTVGVDLNIPSFVKSGKQLTEAEILHTQKIASVRIHVEPVIGRIKNFAILKGTLPLTMARLANQIVYVLGSLPFNHHSFLHHRMTISIQMWSCTLILLKIQTMMQMKVTMIKSFLLI